ncbi:transcription factor boa [Phtheirospermum japonicum]|uniref:Transcription factor boa n=1 Tax=Phtheirospermum japonicum TaxID=374723 RepID=A0A830CZI1_9LAMI|nr:transcription factor boa [Phtheirospermum japonicum]
MMTSPSELSFDCKPHIYSMLQKSFGDQQTSDQQTQKLEEFVARLEDERLKIDAFKRELPLCMQLLTNAMEASRQQLQQQRSNQLGATRPILEEFIPLKNTISPNAAENNNEENNITADKANWMTSAQLWNQEDQNEGAKQSPPLTSTPDHDPQEPEIKLALNGKQRVNGGGAFLPFTPSKDIHHRVASSSCGESFPELALANSSHKEEMIVEDNKKNSSDTSGRKESCGGEKETGNSTAQTHRKARRCWSPDLHRRFVNALHMLGGSQVATPKQIRELMKVDGLTNDEVKSHLQKYRLHTRRPSPSPQAAVTAAPQVVVLGGIWVPPEYAAAHGGTSAAALYGPHGAAAAHHHVAPPFCSPAPPQQQEIYHAIAPPPANPNYQVHHHAGVHHHQQVQYLYNKPPLTQRNSSPESDVQGGAGDPSESIEDGKSESGGSWKADSGGENGGERRSRVDGEESNASTVVSLKF